MNGVSKGIPYRHNFAYRICAVLSKHGQPVTLDEGIALHGYSTTPKRWAMNDAYKAAVVAGYLIERDGKFTPSEKIQGYFANNEVIHTPKPTGELVKPRYIPQTKEMQPKPYPEGVRPISLITLAGGQS